MTEPAAPAPLPPPAEPPPGPPRVPRLRLPLLGAAVATIVVVAILAAIPFWAPPIIRLLPWGAAPAMPRAETESAGRLAALDAAAARQEAAVQRLDQRVGALEARPNDTVQRLEPRLAAVEARPVADLAPLKQQLAAVSDSVAPLKQQLAAVADNLAPLKQQLAGLADSVNGLTARIGAAEQQLRAEAASDPDTVALVLVLLQIRDALEIARPFAGEYDTLAALARKYPDIAAAAAPLAEPAKTGVASRTALVERLRQLAPQIATATAPAAADAGWRGQIKSELHALVVVRRLDGPGQTPAEAAVAKAERDLAGGDLAAAIAALDGLGGAAATAAKPWLDTARQRLAAETALRRLEALAAAQLAAAKPTDGAR